MPRRCNDTSADDDPPPRKKNCTNPTMSSFVLRTGEYLQDIMGKQWKLGKAIGVGGFGEIFLASDDLSEEIRTDSRFVAKVESHRSGPLFVEMNCYLRIAKQAMIEEWKKENKITSLGMPHYVASGSHVHKGEKYRFLILPKFDRDLEKILQEKKMLNLKSVLTISLQIIEVLEYIHSKGYIHSDIKASNILLSNKRIKEKDRGISLNSKVNNTATIKHGINNPLRTCRMLKFPRHTRNLRPAANVNYREDSNVNQLACFACMENDNKLKHPPNNKDQAYLLDFGLASKYLTSEGKHKPYCVDERKAHAGTVLFCSRDAHKGVASRRSDLESLGYNIIYWLTGNLPWYGDTEDPEVVEKKKLKMFVDIEYFLSSCFNEYPRFLEDYFKYLKELKFQDKPDYGYCKKLFIESLKSNGYKNDSCFDFDNSAVALKQTKTKKRVSENLNVRKILHKVSRPPLQSNIPVKPILRKTVKNNRVLRKRNWFEDITDPEDIIKQAREKKNSENSESNVMSSNVADLNIRLLNPTYAMIEVYNKCLERIDASPSHRSDSYMENINGYTYAMISVLQKSRKRKELECEATAVNLNTKNAKSIKRCTIKRRKKYESPAKSPPRTRTTKTANVPAKKENFQGRKIKNVVLRRTYSLRG